MNMTVPHTLSCQLRVCCAFQNLHFTFFWQGNAVSLLVARVGPQILHTTGTD